MTPDELLDLRRQLLSWFDRNRRDLPWRRTRDPYRIWVSEVMLQQTQVATVVPYYNRFVERYPTVAVLAQADLQDVLKSWERMGYYARARNLHAAARRLCDETGGTVPRDPASFRKLPGVGDYITAAVMSIAFDYPLPVVDGNVKRVISRIFRLETPVNVPATSTAHRVFADAAGRLLDHERPGDHNQAMMELGATVCRPRNPECEGCPVSTSCEARRTGKQADYPVRRARRRIPHHHVAVAVVRRGERVLITRRPEKGLLGGLWEFPGGKVRSGESPEDACRREVREEVNVEIDAVEYLTRIHHAYTHFSVAMDVYACTYAAGDVRLSGATDHRWVLVDELDTYPFPGANHKFLPLVKDRLRSF